MRNTKTELTNILRAPLAICLLAGALLGCSEDEVTALELRLSIDRQLNTKEQVLAVVGSMELQLDAASGFAGVDREGASVGPLTAKNLDSDSKLELTLRREVRGALPKIRLLPGSNLDRTFKVTARGLAGETLAALGGLSSVTFEEGETLDVIVPFNLRAAFLPPRVVVTLPQDGEIAAALALTIFVQFSKLVDTNSVARSFRVVHEASGQQVPGKPSVSVSTVVDGAGVEEKRSAATYLVGCPLNPGKYRIEVGADVTDLQGNKLLQDASASTQGMVSHFTIPGTAADTPCGEPGPTPGCQNDLECNPSGEGHFKCVKKESQGYCVPVVDDCDKLNCPPNYVCKVVDGNTQPQPPSCPPTCDQQCIQNLGAQGISDPEAHQKCCQPDCSNQPPEPPPLPGGQLECVQDCRTLGFCVDGSYCDQNTGSCHPCDPSGSPDPNDPGCAEPPQPPAPPPPPSDCKSDCEAMCNDGPDSQQCQQCMSGCANQ